MLAVLARASDGLAAAILRMAAVRGVAAVRVAALDQVRFSMRIDATGRAQVSLLLTETSTPVTSVVNRYPYLDGPGADQEAAFIQAENTAAWWAVLGSFCGPVVNRPDSRGLLPSTDRALGTGVPVRRPVQIFRASFRPARDGVLSSSDGRTVQQAGVEVEARGLAGFQGLHLEGLRQYVVAGRRLLRMDGTRPSLAESARVLGLLRAELPALAIVVVETTGDTADEKGGSPTSGPRTTLVDFDPFLDLGHLGTAGQAVATALLEDCLI
ncbi:hypothetical protein [Streptomyces sp. NPDC001933]|uniref:hypothetical protein n=1 Tax=Streptomyces sp. NPDC001933 TaxID=3364626 RepID=UPI00368DD47C